VSVADSSNQIVTGLAVTSIFKSPVDSRIDCRVMLTDQMNGHYTGIMPCGAGQWNVESIARRDGDIVYRSTNRIILH
jgi:nitrogen fixation protein FixH